MIRYDDHAEFQIARRGIDKAWIEDVVINPDQTESSGGRQSFLRLSSWSACDASSGDARRRSNLRHHGLFRQDEATRVRVDRDADAVYLNLTDAAVLESEEVAEGIVVDYDAAGRIVGIEILDASRRTGTPRRLRS